MTGDFVNNKTTFCNGDWEAEERAGVGRWGMEDWKRELRLESSGKVLGKVFVWDGILGIRTQGIELRKGRLGAAMGRD